jgi:hypothetical protein
MFIAPAAMPLAALPAIPATFFRLIIGLVLMLIATLHVPPALGPQPLNAFPAIRACTWTLNILARAAIQYARLARPLQRIVCRVLQENT